MKPASVPPAINEAEALDPIALAVNDAAVRMFTELQHHSHLDETVLKRVCPSYTSGEAFIRERVTIEPFIRQAETELGDSLPTEPNERSIAILNHAVRVDGPFFTEAKRVTEAVTGQIIQDAAAIEAASRLQAFSLIH